MGKILNTLTIKINNNKVLSKVEGMALVMLPKSFLHDSKILKTVCMLLSKAKFEDEFFKFELILEMKCMIHKYAKNIDEIKELEEVIGLIAFDPSFEHEMKARENHAKFELALKFKDSVGVNIASKVSGFSVRELENEKLENNVYHDWLDVNKVYGL